MKKPAGGNAHPVDPRFQAQLAKLDAAIVQATQASQWAQSTELRAKRAQLLRKISS